MKYHIASVFLMLGFVLLFWGSTSTFESTFQTSQQVDGPDSIDYQMDYLQPSITPVASTQMRIDYKGVLIVCEVVPIEVNPENEWRRVPWTGGINQQPQARVFQVYEVPVYRPDRDRVVFKITLKNKQDRVLKLVEAPIVMMIDGNQYELPEDVYVEWNNAMVIKGFQKEYTLQGPTFEQLQEARKIYLSINDVPVEYDQAGTVLEKKNFEWNFDCGVTQVQREIRLPVTYEPRKLQYSATWQGWEVVVQTEPSFLPVFGYDPELGDYRPFPNKTSSKEPNKYMAYNKETKIFYPIRIEYRGRMYDIYPMEGENLREQSMKVEVDFSQSPPTLKGGVWGIRPEDFPKKKANPDQTMISDYSVYEKALIGTWIYRTSEGRISMVTYSADHTFSTRFNGIDYLSGEWAVSKNVVSGTYTSVLSEKKSEFENTIVYFRQDEFQLIDGGTKKALTCYRTE